MSYIQLGANLEEKLKKTVLKVTDKLGVTKYADQLFSADEEGSGIPETVPPPAPPPEPETPWLAYGAAAGAAFLLWKAIR